MSERVEYFIEVTPGTDLDNIIAATKAELITTLGSSIIDDPSQSKFLRDSPHFTLQVAATEDFEGMLNAYRNVARRFSPISYFVNGTGRVDKGGFIEVHATVLPADQRMFRDVHYAVIEASKRHLSTQPPRMFAGAKLPPYEQANLEYCHFPPGRGNYAPHASVGRFSPTILQRADVEQVLSGFEPLGAYTTGPSLIVWPYKRDDPTFGTEKPIYIDLKE